MLNFFNKSKYTNKNYPPNYLTNNNKYKSILRLSINDS